MLCQRAAFLLIEIANNSLKQRSQPVNSAYCRWQDQSWSVSGVKFTEGVDLNKTLFIHRNHKLNK